MLFPSNSSDLIKKYAVQAITDELDSMQSLKNYIDDDFVSVVQLLLSNQGRAIFTGIGKSAIIAQKIVATLNSTGQPSLFMHAADAIHGDLGMIQQNDLVIAISKSGNTPEIIALAPLVKRFNNTLVAMVGITNSRLAQLSDFVLNTTIDREACPNNLAPTTSTTAQLIMGDALAVALLEARGFSADDFALSHPGGSLGRRLLLRLQDVMHMGNQIPTVPASATIKEALLEISEKGLGMTAIVATDGTLAGIFTDGDLRRLLDLRIDIHQTAIADVMVKNCITAKPEMLAAEALKIMEQRKINGLIIVSNGNIPVGAMNMHDLLRAGVM